MIAVVGSVNMDAVVRVERLPAEGETVLGESLDWLPGGKGANQAVAAARAGGPAALVARVGDDDAGRTLRTMLAAEGVDVASVSVTPDAPTGVALITVAADGSNTIVVAPLANRLLSRADVDAAAVIGQARVVLCQLEIPLESVVGAFGRARAVGAITVLNLSPARDLDRSVLELVDVVVANEHEAEALGEVSPCRALVVTRGASGATVTVGGETHVVPTDAVDAVDTTGAGDAFCGALAAGLARGLDIVAAARLGAAAGTEAVTRLGAR